MRYRDARLLIFARAPVPGQVKTRLQPLLGDSGAAELYLRMLESVVALACDAALCPVELFVTPDDRHGFFDYCRQRYRVAVCRQCAGDLGQRMSNAIDTTLQSAGQVVLIGSDCPSLTADDIDAAFRALTGGSDVVLGPAMDGGYYLVGCTRPYPGLFSDIEWSGPSVLPVTRARLAQMQLSVHELRALPDLDTPEDFLALTRPE